MLSHKTYTDLKHCVHLWLHLCLFPLPAITTHYHHSQFQGEVLGGTVFPMGSAGPCSSSSSLPPSIHSSIMCRLLNGAVHLASDPFQWAMRFQRCNAPVVLGGVIWSNPLALAMFHSIQGALSLWTFHPSRPVSFPSTQRNLLFPLHQFTPLHHFTAHTKVE